MPCWRAIARQLNAGSPRCSTPLAVCTLEGALAGQTLDWSAVSIEHASVKASWTRSLVLPLLFASVAGCSSTTESGEVAAEDYPRAISQTRCDSHFACDCNAFTDQPWTEEGCVDVGAEALTMMVEDMLALGYTYDPSCPARFANRVDELSCSTDWSRINQECETCRSFHGDVQEGQPCEAAPYSPGPRYSNCAQGLSCDYDEQTEQSICSDPCKNRTVYLEDGEACDGAEADQCLMDLACGDSGVCEPAPGVGEPCPDLRCSDAYCDQDAANGPTCIPLLAVGESCLDDRECENRWCVNFGGGSFCDDPYPRVCRFYDF